MPPTEDSSGWPQDTLTAPTAGTPPVALFLFELDGPILLVDAWDSFDLDGDIVAFHWEWGDGTQATGADMETHVYADPFVPHIVTLTVEDDDGLRDTSSLLVPAWDGPVVARILVWAEGSTLVVDGGASDATPFGIVSWTWDWGDDSAPGRGPVAEHRYGAPGDHTVTLTVMDEAGRTATATHLVRVEAVSPRDPVLRVAADPDTMEANGDAPRVVATSGSETPLLVFLGLLGVAGRLVRRLD